MVHAFIMVKAAAGQAEEVVERIRDVEEVTEAHVIAGEFDAIAEVDADEVYEVLHTASSAIQGVAGVTDTKTYIALD